MRTDMQPSIDYYNLEKKEKDSAISFILESLIRCREDLRLPSNKKIFDEDVNIYLAHLLLAFATASYHSLVGKYLSVYDSEIRELVEASRDHYVRYFIFKANADYLLIHLGIFQDLDGSIRFGRSTLGRSDRYFMQNAITYYEEAASYNQRIYRKRTAVKDVLLKLALYFSDYCDLLKRARREYFHFVNHFEDEEFKKFMGSVALYEKEMAVKELENQFLDLYLEWMKHPSRELEMRIRELTCQIRKSDPSFNFQLEIKK